jgi:plasmid stability protein
MATLTIRDLDETLKQSLRIRAARRNRSMEEEARQILRAALLEAPGPEGDLVSRIRARFAGLGDVEFAIAEREPLCPTRTFDERSPAERRPVSKSATRASRRG